MHNIMHSHIHVYLLIYLSDMHAFVLYIYLDVYLYLLNWIFDHSLGAVSIRKTVLPGMAIPMLKIRRPNGRLIFNMEIAILR